MGPCLGLVLAADLPGLGFKVQGQGRVFKRLSDAEAARS